MATLSETATAEPGRATNSYRAVWRWHFYAGVLCIPFVIWLASTGSIYLFKPQIEGWLDRPFDHVAVTQPAAPSAIVGAALAAVPGSTLNAYEAPASPTAAPRVLVSKGEELVRVYVDPNTAKVLKTVNEDDRFMNVVFLLHGELLAGERGSYVVELAACWAIVMVLTGLFLWWPRQGGLAGVVWPRLGKGSRYVWRDLHAVTGFWVSAFAIILLLSGLPWAKNWGSYLKEVRGLTGTAEASQDWTNGRADVLAQRRGQDAEVRAAASGEHAGHMGHGMEAAPAPGDAFNAIDRVAPTVQALNLPPPVLITPPIKAGDVWSARSEAANRPLRTNLQLDGETGELIGRRDFDERHWIDRLVGYGIAAHEGALFGWLNQLLGLFTALGLVLLSISAVVLWWRRRDVGVLGAPKALSRPRLTVALAAVIIALGAYLPLFGFSLIVVLLIERLVLQRVPAARDWLGLTPA